MVKCKLIFVYIISAFNPNKAIKCSSITNKCGSRILLKSTSDDQSNKKWVNPSWKCWSTCIAVYASTVKVVSQEHLPDKDLS